MTVVGYHDPPDWDYIKIKEHGGQNVSIQILGIFYMLVGPLLMMNLLLAITVNNTTNLRMRGKAIQTNSRVKDFFQYAIFADACYTLFFKKNAAGFKIMEKFKKCKGKMVNIKYVYKLY